jgi:hypothetical protein
VFSSQHLDVLASFMATIKNPYAALRADIHGLLASKCWSTWTPSLVHHDIFVKKDNAALIFSVCIFICLVRPYRPTRTLI